MFLLLATLHLYSGWNDIRLSVQQRYKRYANAPQCNGISILTIEFATADDDLHRGEGGTYWVSIRLNRQVISLSLSRRPSAVDWRRSNGEKRRYEWQAVLWRFSRHGEWQAVSPHSYWHSPICFAQQMLRIGAIVTGWSFAPFRSTFSTFIISAKSNICSWTYWCWNILQNTNFRNSGEHQPKTNSQMSGNQNHFWRTLKNDQWKCAKRSPANKFGLKKCL